MNNMEGHISCGVIWIKPVAFTGSHRNSVFSPAGHLVRSLPLTLLPPIVSPLLSLPCITHLFILYLWIPGPALFPSLLSPSSTLTTPLPIYSSSVSVPCTVTMLSVFGPGRGRKQNTTLSLQLQPCAALTSSEQPDSQSVRNTITRWIIKQVRRPGCRCFA